MLAVKSSASVRHLCFCKRAGFWLLSEQSDREANECWLNRWVVTLLHWRGFTGDMMHCFTMVVGRQWARSVGCLCEKCQSVSISKARGVADMCPPQNLNWCLHNSKTALALFHWHFMTSQNFSSAHPMFPLGQRTLYFQSLNGLLVLTTAAFSLGHPFRPGLQSKKLFFPWTLFLTVPPVYLK